MKTPLKSDMPFQSYGQMHWMYLEINISDIQLTSPDHII